MPPVSCQPRPSALKEVPQLVCTLDFEKQKKTVSRDSLSCPGVGGRLGLRDLSHFAQIQAGPESRVEGSPVDGRLCAGCGPFTCGAGGATQSLCFASVIPLGSTKPSPSSLAP